MVTELGEKKGCHMTHCNTFKQISPKMTQASMIIITKFKDITLYEQKAYHLPFSACRGETVGGEIKVPSAETPELLKLLRTQSC